MEVAEAETQASEDARPVEECQEPQWVESRPEAEEAREPRPRVERAPDLDEGEEATDEEEPAEGRSSPAR